MHSSLFERLRHLYLRLIAELRSTKGRNILVYLMCVCVAFGFWLLMSLDQEVQSDFDVPLILENRPDSVTLIGALPRTISATVQAKNSQLLRFQFGSPVPLKVKFEDYVIRPGVFSMPHNKIDTRLREYFGAGAQIVSLRPDSIIVSYTTNPGKRLPLRVVTDIKTNLQCTLSGPIMASVDSVTVYSNDELPHDITYVETQPVVKSGLKDTTRVEVAVQGIPGARIIPSSILITIPVEPLIQKRRQVKVEAINIPEGFRMITFPPKVEVSYLVPISLYNEDFTFKATVDYQDIYPGEVRLPVTLKTFPGNYHSPELETDSVEYVLEPIR